MGWFVPLTLHLCAFTAFGQDLYYDYYDYTTDSPAEDTDLSYGAWLFELLDVTGHSLV